ncbi:hypothetical protein [Halalkalibacter okhensis]|uniref:Abortive phage infection protein n=1 Tax=Halalkalibacter okhensis TaxID=333138 RepID=A0A0B0IH95_9BACI|nr:hypothetical protein [Halalkalibacter okhensis]KHF40680.1 hypothetical protein LQ50_07720 [Halalkalibacter okhensis]
MDQQEVLSILNQLRNQEVQSYRVTKEDFHIFRTNLLKQEDAINFRGNAQHGGETIYTYEPEWTK